MVSRGLGEAWAGPGDPRSTDIATVLISFAGERRMTSDIPFKATLLGTFELEARIGPESKTADLGRVSGNLGLGPLISGSHFPTVSISPLHHCQWSVLAIGWSL